MKPSTLQLNGCSRYICFSYIFCNQVLSIYLQVCYQLSFIPPGQQHHHVEAEFWLGTTFAECFLFSFYESTSPSVFLLTVISFAFVFEKVAEGATALYMEQLRGIQYITDRGAQQLSVDIEYLSNVLSALSMPIPTCLATFQTCFSTPKDQLKDLIKSDSGNQLDLPTANLVCKMRRISLEWWLLLSHHAVLLLLQKWYNTRPICCREFCFFLLSP